MPFSNNFSLKSLCLSKWLHIVIGDVLQSYLKSQHVFCNETGIFDLEEAVLGTVVIKKKKFLAETITSCVLNVSE